MFLAMKKKREKSELAAFSKIIIPKEFHSTDAHIENHLTNLEKANSFEKQQESLTAVSLSGLLQYIF